MSVEKMNYYKEQKSHRKQNLAKEKRRKKAAHAAWVGGGIVVAAALIAAVGLTGYNEYQARQAAKPDYSVDSLVLQDYAGILNPEEAIEGEAAEEICDRRARSL